MFRIRQPLFFANPIEQRKSPDKKFVPGRWELPPEDLTLQMLIEASAFPTVGGMALPFDDDSDWGEHVDRVYKVEVEKGDVHELAQFPNAARVKFVDEKTTVLPNEIAENRNIRVLELNENKKFRKLHKNLGKMTWLEGLEIINLHSLRDISVLEGLENLKFLRFYNTDEIEDWSIVARLPELHTLGLDRLSGDGVPEVLSEMQHLRNLSLGSSLWPGDTSPLGCLENLERLILSGTWFTELPAELEKLTSLEQLELGGNDEIEDWSSLGALQSLRALALEGWEEELPDALGALKSLEWLSLSHSSGGDDVRFGALAGLRSLESLDLQGCEFSGLPGGIGELHNLRELNLTHARSVEDFSALRGLRRLEYLDLSLCRIAELPEVIMDLPVLRYLDLGQTKIDLTATDLHEHPSLEAVRFRRSATPDDALDIVEDRFDEVWRDFSYAFLDR